MQAADEARQKEEEEKKKKRMSLDSPRRRLDGLMEDANFLPSIYTQEVKTWLAGILPLLLEMLARPCLCLCVCPSSYIQCRCLRSSSTVHTPSTKI